MLECWTLFAAAMVLFITLADSVQAATFEELFEKGIRARNAGDFDTAENLFSTALALEPRNADALLLLGLVKAYKKRYDDALEILDEGLAVSPERVDLLLARARVTFWVGRNVEAESAFRVVLEKEPTNVAALIGLGDALRGQGKPGKAREYYESALTLEPNSADANKRLQAVEAESLAWQVNAGYVRSQFGRRPVKDWHEGYAQLVRRFGDDTIVDGRYQRSQRRGFIDENLQLGISYRFSRGLGAYGRIEVTPSADFLPRWGAAAGGDVRLFDGTDWFGPLSVTLDLRHRHYGLVDVSNADPGLVLYLLDGRVWITGRLINAYDDSAKDWLDGWFAKIDVQVHDRVRVYAGRAKSPETDFGETVDVFTTLAGAIVDVTPALGVRVDFSYDDRKQSYTRRELSLGLSYRF